MIKEQLSMLKIQWEGLKSVFKQIKKKDLLHSDLRQLLNANLK